MKGSSGYEAGVLSGVFQICVLLSLACVGPAPARAADKPYAPTWKFRTHNVRVELQADGTSTTRYENAYTILAESALKSMSDEDISYHENDGKLEDIVAYTEKADGTKIDVPETNVQVTSYNGVNGAPPAFSDLKNRHLVFPNVEVGDTVVIGYTIRDEKPTFKGYYSLLTSYSDAIAYDDAKLTITAPRSLGLKYKSYNLPEPEVSAPDANRQRWTWTYRNPAPKDMRKESSQFERAWHFSDRPGIQISNFKDYGQIAAAYEAEASRRAAVNDRIRKLAADIVKETSSNRERAEKIYAWVAKEIGFAGNCLAGGDVVPRETDLVLNLKMGDCKDHATLVQALLSALGIKSTQVLINAAEGYDVPEIPCWQAFNHVINYLPEFDLYLDATSSSSPFGVLPGQEYGKPVIHTSAFTGILHTPLRSGDGNWSKSVDRMTILADGAIEASGSYRLGGATANTISHYFAQWKQSPNFDDGAQYLEQQIRGRGYKGRGAYENVQDTRGASDSFSYGMHYRIDDLVDTTNPYGLQLSTFFPNPSPISSLAAYAAADPYAHDFLCRGDSRSEDLTITFPANVKLLAIPKNAHTEAGLLQFDARYERHGNTIHVVRSVVDKTPGPICAPDVSVQYARIGAAIKKDMKAQAVYQPN